MSSFVVIDGKSLLFCVGVDPDEAEGPSVFMGFLFASKEKVISCVRSWPARALSYAGLLQLICSL